MGGGGVGEGRHYRDYAKQTPKEKGAVLSRPAEKFLPCMRLGGIAYFNLGESLPRNGDPKKVNKEP